MTDQPCHVVYLSLGANIGQRRRTLRRAIREIADRIGPVVRQSAFHETEPWGFSSQHAFINAAVCVHTSLSPEELLCETQRIERLLGRTPDTKRAAHTEGAVVYHDRVIDIDILLYDDLTVRTPQLTIPHPLMRERDFVMQPLSEILPEKQ